MKTTVKLIVIGFVSILIASCASYQKKLNKAKNFLLADPTELSKLCSDRFPNKNEYIKGKTDTVAGATIYVKGDSVKCPDGTKKKAPDKSVKCPPSTHSVDTIKVADSAMIYYLTAQIKKADDSLNIYHERMKVRDAEIVKTKKENRKKIFIIIGLCALIGGGVLAKIKGVI